MGTDIAKNNPDLDYYVKISDLYYVLRWICVDFYLLIIFLSFFAKENTSL
jgi:hypothetical protein